MKILTPQQIEEVLEIVDRYTLTFIAQSIGTNILTKKDKQVLNNAGIDLSKLKFHDSEVVQAFKFGILSDAIGHSASKKMTYEQFKKSLKEGTFIPLNKTESAMVQSLQYNTYAHVSKLGGNIKNDIRSGIVEVDRKGMAKAGLVVRSAVKEAIEKRKSVSEVVSIIGKKTEQWNRDLLRIAEYNMHEAFNQGRLANMERSGAKKVYFDVYPGACKHCIRVYLTAGYGSEPKQFTPLEIRSNGTNIGRKAKDWLATLGPVHPYCRCTINEVDDGYIWDPSTRSFSKIDERKLKNGRAPVKVTIRRNGEETKTKV